MSLKTTESVINNNMAIVPHPHYSPNFALCDSAVFPKLNMKLKGHFETVCDIYRESQAVLDSIKENDFHSPLKHGKIDGIAAYITKETILKEMAAKIE
jgi:hypothetical protein